MLTHSQVVGRLLEIVLVKTGGTGTAFWASVGSNTELITAAHVPWKKEFDAGSVPPSSEVLEIRWRLGLTAGQCMAEFRSHPDDPKIDYATVYFIDDPVNHPVPAPPFSLSAKSLSKDDSVSAFGFPDSLNNPRGSKALQCEKSIGIVQSVQAGLPEYIFSAGRSEEGISGGPAFLYMDEDQFGEDVVGLMRGSPPEAVNAQNDLAHSFVLLGATSFR